MLSSVEWKKSFYLIHLHLPIRHGVFLVAKGFEVIGVSPDSEKSHTNFISKFDLPYNLVADTEKEILKAYGAWGLKKMYGKEYEGVLRTTYIIAEDVKILKVFKKVQTKDHTEQILKELEA